MMKALFCEDYLYYFANRNVNTWQWPCKGLYKNVSSHSYSYIMTLAYTANPRTTRLLMNSFPVSSTQLYRNSVIRLFTSLFDQCQDSRGKTAARRQRMQKISHVCTIHSKKLYYLTALHNLPGRGTFSLWLKAECGEIAIVEEWF